MLKKINDKGFSLVELIVVVAIVIILTAALVPNVIGYINKANVAVTKSAAETVYNASVHYIYSEIGKGNSFAPNSNIDPTILWDPNVLLIKEPKDYSTIEIKVDSTGRLIKYVYYVDSGGNAADFPVGASGKVN